jgi:DNA invertase Pin-like site-specific DNA recombinase
LTLLSPRRAVSESDSELAGVAFKVVDDPTIDTTSRTGKLIMGILAPIAEFENDIRRERQMDGIARAKDRGIQFGRKLELTPEKIAEIKALLGAGGPVPDIIRQVGLSKATVYRALGRVRPRIGLELPGKRGQPGSWPAAQA